MLYVYSSIFGNNDNYRAILKDPSVSNHGVVHGKLVATSLGWNKTSEEYEFVRCDERDFYAFSPAFSLIEYTGEILELDEL